MIEEFKIILAVPFNGYDGWNNNAGQYFKVKKDFIIPENKVVLIAPFYKTRAFTLNFYKVIEDYDNNGLDNAIIKGENFDELAQRALIPAITANIDISFYVDFCREKERLNVIEKELKKATKDISFYMQMKTLAEINPDKYGPLVEEWKKLTFKDSMNLLEAKDASSTEE